MNPPPRNVSRLSSGPSRDGCSPQHLDVVEAELLLELCAHAGRCAIAAKAARVIPLQRPGHNVRGHAN